jgi:tight adherence protein C
MSPLMGWATLFGVSLGVGLWSLAALLPRLSRPSLRDRVAPYVVDVSEGARTLLARRTTEPLSLFGAMLAPSLARARVLLDRILGGSATIELRLRQAGSRRSVDEFRSSQVLWALVGAGTGAALAGIMAVSGGQLGLGVVVVLVGAAAGVVGRDYLLQRRAGSRLARMRGELPTVLEFLTLSLSAGEGILDAIRRVGMASGGELATELARVSAAVNTGLPLAESLARLAGDISLPPLTRAIDQIVGALDRGTPLADVLRAQAQDARENTKRELLEQAGKKEVAMLVPLVFLILPLTIVFAIFPGIAVLRVGL